MFARVVEIVDDVVISVTVDVVVIVDVVVATFSRAGKRLSVVRGS